jgi:predicted nucleic acid-binding Zn ribbon protein
MYEKQCPICGKPLGRNKYTCSRKCYNIWRSHTKICVVCGKSYYDAPSNDTVTCSPDCSKDHRQQLYYRGTYNKALQRAHEILPLHPLTGMFDTNVHAKEWVIQSPGGRKYKCRNLLNWLREHSDMLEGTPMQAWDGIVKIKYSMQGKRKYISHQWKGWRLLEYGD